MRNMTCKALNGKFGEYVGTTECFSCVWRPQCIKATTAKNNEPVNKKPFYLNLYEKIRSYAFSEGCCTFNRNEDGKGTRYESPLFFQRKDSIRIISADENSIWILRKKGQTVDYIVVPNAD